MAEQQEFKIDAGNKFLMVVSLLALAGALAFLVYHLVGFLGQVGLAERDPAPGLAETVDQRIAPVGRVEVAPADAQPVATAPRAASEVYRSVCAACHDTGAAGAPKKSDGDEWGRRLNEKGLETLVDHSINGFQGMPARGGNPNVSDEELSSTVAYILAEAGVAVDTAEAVATVADAAEAAPATAGDPARGQERYAVCVSCHGAEGEGMGIFPKIAERSADYIAGRLQQYRAGEMVGPNTPLMAPHASALSDDAIADLAAYVATLGVAAEEAAPAEEEAPAGESAPVAAGDPERGQERYAVCVSCHGAEGQGMGIFPKIAGQTAEYIVGRLQQYRAGETVGPNTPLMAPHASALSDDAIADLAAYVAKLGAPEPAAEPESAVEEAAVEEAAVEEAAVEEAADGPAVDETAVETEAAAGEEAAVEAEAAVAGDADRGRERYAVCVGCHGPSGQGMGIFPKIAGQTAEYVAGKLKQYRAGETVGPNTPLMRPHAAALSDEAIADLSAFIASF